jgi:hypothetical protein
MIESICVRENSHMLAKNSHMHFFQVLAEGKLHISLREALREMVQVMCKRPLPHLLKLLCRWQANRTHAAFFLEICMNARHYAFKAAGIYEIRTTWRCRWPKESNRQENTVVEMLEIKYFWLSCGL